MTTLKYKCINVVREEYELDHDDNRVSFDEDMEKQRENFFKSSTVLDEKNGKGTILYKNAEDNYRLIPDCYLYVDMLEFVVKKHAQS